MLGALKTSNWTLGRNAATDELQYCSPNKLFLKSRELQIFFKGNEDVYFLAEDENRINWTKLGVRDKPIHNIRTHPCWGNSNDVNLSSSRGWHVRGINGFDPDAMIEGLDHALKSITKEKAIYIWNELLPPLTRFLKGSYLTATRQNFENALTYTDIDSKMCKMLKDYKWIPSIDGAYYRPADCCVSEFIVELYRNSDLINILNIDETNVKISSSNLNESDANNQLINEFGISLKDLEFVKNNLDKFEQWKADICSYKERPVFPARVVLNTERRQGLLGEQLRTSPKKKYETRERSVRTTSGVIDPITWLRSQYTNGSDQMVCQICKEEMPFRKRDRTHYFEKKEVFSRKYLPKEHEAQYLALCPLCAAKYDEFIKTDDDVMAGLRLAIVSAEDCEIPISLGEEKTSIRFVETHYQDLRTIIAESFNDKN